jgi:hypothetical protein
MNRSRILTILILVLSLLLLAASPAYATTSVSLTAAVNGASIQAQVSGTAEDCSDGGFGCSGQTVTLVVDPNLSECISDVGETIGGSTAIPVTGGPFNFTYTLPEQGGTYVLCAYVDYDADGLDLYATEVSAPVTVTVPAQPCVSGTGQSLAFSAPVVIAYGRRAVIYVHDPSDDVVSNITLTGSTPPSPSPSYSHQFTSDEISSLEGGDAVAFSATLSRRKTAAVVSLAYTESIGAQVNGADETEVCTTSQTTEVRGIAGALPSVKVKNLSNALTSGNPSVSVAFSAAGGCARTRKVRESITVTGSGANLRASTTDECSQRWTRRGHIPGVSTTTKRNSSGSVFSFKPGKANAKYRLVVRVNGRIVKRGHLTAVYNHQPANRVWEGTDEFVNYCINDSRPTYSLDLRLYCWNPAITTKGVTFASS